MNYLYIGIMVFCVSSAIFSQEIPTFHSSFNLFEGYNNQKLLKKVQFSSNLGVVSMGVDLPLPASYPEIEKTLRLSYSSMRFKNFGMGYGFNWSLPQIIRVYDNPRVDYIYIDEAGSSELVDRGDFLYELSLKSFIEIERNDDGYLVTYPSGEIREFSSDGLIEKDCKNYRS